MGPVWSLARTEMRSRWVALVGLGLIVALATAVVLTAVVGARRTSSTVERFEDWTSASDAGIQTNEAAVSAQLSATVASLPQTRATSTRYLINGFPSGADESTPDFAIYTDPDGHYGRDIDRPLLLRGRTFDDQSPDEVVLDELAAQVLHLDVGDHVQVATWSPEDLDQLTAAGADFPGFNGPPLDLTVVGVGRTSEGLGGNVQRAALVALAGPGLMAAHPGLGAWPPLVAVRVDDARRDLPTVAEAIGAVGDDRQFEVVTAEDKYLHSVHRSVDTLSTGLWIFALVAGAAALVTVGQAVSRQVSASAAANDTVRALGMTRAERAMVGALPVMEVTIVGVGLGLIGAVALSPLLPTGVARSIEVQPGIWIDGWALALGGLVIIGLLLGWAFLASSRAQRHATTARATSRPSSVAQLLAAAGTPPAIVTGVRHTFEAHDRLSVPVRSALIAATIAVAGVIGAGVVVASLHDVETTSSRWGWTWSAQPDAFGDEDPTEQLAQDDRLAAVVIEQSNAIFVNDTAINGSAMEPLKGTLDFTVAAGRLPQGPSEIALDPRTMDKMGVSIGDTVQARTSTEDTSTVDLTVVGNALVPDDSGTLGLAVLTPAGLQAIALDDMQSTPLLRYPDGVDAAALEQQLSEDYGLSFPLFSHAQPPGPVTNVGQGRGVAIALAAFFILLGVAGLFHALTLSTRRRRFDFAVLRAIGFRRRQVRESVIAQSITIGVVGLVIGIPAGLIVGRAFWHRLIADVGVLDWPTNPWLLVVVVVPAVLAVAAVVAMVPAQVAAHASTSRLQQGD